MKGLIGKKVGMTQLIAEDGKVTPMTLIEAGPCFVTQVRTVAHEGYDSVQLGFEEVNPKELAAGERGHLKRANLPPLRHLREFRGEFPELKQGDKVTRRRLCPRRRGGCDRHQQGQGLSRRHQALSFQPPAQDARRFRPDARARLERPDHHARPPVQGQAHGRSHGQRPRHLAEYSRGAGRRRAQFVGRLRGSVPGGKGTIVIVRERNR